MIPGLARGVYDFHFGRGARNLLIIYRPSADPYPCHDVTTLTKGEPDHRLDRHLFIFQGMLFTETITRAPSGSCHRLVPPHAGVAEQSAWTRVSLCLEPASSVRLS